MRHYSLIFSFFICLLLLSACRNEPKLPLVEKDTEVSVRVSSPTGLNPLMNYDTDALLIMRQIYLPLLGFNSSNYELEPILAKSLPTKQEVTGGELAGLIAFTFEILEEAVWDDGTPITGKDFLFTVKATYNPNYRSPYNGQFNQIKQVDIDATNAKKFTVYHEKYVIAEPSIGNFTMLPAHLLDPQGVYDKYSITDMQNPKNKEKLASDEALKTVGTLFVSPKNMGQEGEMNGSGAYKLQDWVTGQSLTLVKKKNWWGEQFANRNNHFKAIPKKITFKIIPDFNAAISLMRNGQLDVVKSVPNANFIQLKEDNYFKENYNFYTPSMFRHGYVMLNTTDPRLNDKKVRRALAHLFDTDEIFETVYFGEKNPVATPIHPSKSTYNKNLSPIKYNLDKAKELLSEAGWRDSNNNGVLDKTINGQLQELNLRITYAGGNAAGIAEIFSNKAKAAGVNIEKTLMDVRLMQQGWRQKDFELTIKGSSWFPFHKDLYQNWHTRGAGNYASFGNAESDALIEEIQETVDEDKLKELYMKIQEIIYEEQPVIFLNVANERIAVNKKFGKITTTGISPGFLINEFSESLVPTNISQN